MWRPAALVTLTEQVRPDAKETLEYFADQGVEIKIISGDNPTTVAAIARRVGLHITDENVVDARTIGDDPEELREIVERTTVFGRVSPEQKRALVQALQRNGHVAAMTGDGVNDALALKDADIGVAMGNGAQATKAVAQLVLLDGRFSHMPSVLAEGRRVIGNVERVANLFVSKNVMSLVAIISAALFTLPFPFLPRHLTLVSAVTIGIPAFFLALGPNKRRYVPGFLRRVLRFAVPAGVVRHGGARLIHVGAQRGRRSPGVGVPGADRIQPGRRQRHLLAAVHRGDDLLAVHRVLDPGGALPPVPALEGRTGRVDGRAGGAGVHPADRPVVLQFLADADHVVGIAGGRGRRRTGNRDHLPHRTRDARRRSDLSPRSARQRTAEVRRGLAGSARGE